MAMNMHTPIDMGTVDTIDEGQSRKRRRLIIGAVVLVVAILAGLYMLKGGKKIEAPAAPELPTVTVVVPGTTVVADQVRVTGTVAAKREMPVGVQGEGGMI